jgi:ectoine hydroxylase-related dioxygenase (phytanoyl-CoA dioxygenase family)
MRAEVGVGTRDGEPLAEADLRRELDERGYAVVPGFLSAEEMAPALAELPILFPTAEEYHSGADPERASRFRDDQFKGITYMPFEAIEWSLLAVNDRIIDLAAACLGTTDLRLYDGEAWAKYTGATDYEQRHHRDFFDHTPMVPTDDPRYGQLEIFVYFDEVTDDLGATRVVPNEHVGDVPLVPMAWSQEDAPHLYDHEVAVTGPPGTLLVYRPSTLHRGTQLTRPDAARFTLHMNYRTAEPEWANRIGWANESIKPCWHDFVNRASYRQVLLFGFPPDGHPYWTPATVDGVALRYPGLDMRPWRNALVQPPTSSTR